MRLEMLGQFAGALRQARCHIVAVSEDGVDRRGMARANADDEVVAVRGEFLCERRGRLRQLARHRVAVQADRLRGVGAAFAEAIDEFVAARAKFRTERLAGGAQLLIDAGNAAEQVVRRLLAGPRETRADIEPERRQIVMHLRRLRGDTTGRGVAGALERNGDFFRGGTERSSDPLAGAGDAFAQAVGDPFEVGGDALMGAGDGGAHPSPIGDNRFALIRHFGDQRTHPALVVGIRALQRRDFRAHKRLKLRGARQSALDAVAERRDFAANCLGKGDDLLGRQRFGLGEAHRDLGKRLCRQPQFLRPAHHRG